MRDVMLDYYDYVDEILAPEDVHDAQAAEPGMARIGQAVLLSIILSVGYGLLLYFALDQIISGWLFAIIHILASVVLGVIVYAQYKTGIDIPFMALLAVSSSVMGVFGALGTLLSIIAYLLFRVQANSFSEWFELIFPSDISSKPEDVYNEIVVGIDENPQAYEVTPFIDVMQLGSEEQKRRALSKMTMRFHPRLAPAILMALRDPSNAIRVQAATSVAKIEANFMHKLHKLEQARELEPTNVHLQFAQAKFYDDYAYTGLLDKERELLNREKAIASYKAYLQHDPNNQEAWAAIGRLLYRSQHWQEAADWFENALDRNINIQSMVLWYLECLYRLGEYQKLRKLAKEYAPKLVDIDELPADVSDALKLWAV